MDNPINKTDPDGRGVNDNNLIPEITVTAPAPQNNGDNVIATWYQGLLNQANSKPQNTKPSQSGSNNFISPRPITLNLPNVNPPNAQNNLKDIGDAIAAVGIAGSSCDVFVKNQAGKQIIYVTLKGTNAAVNSAKVLSVLKGLGTATIVVGVAVDAIRSFNGEQSWAKTGVNSAVAIVAGVIGGIPGLIMIGGYYVIDNTVGWDNTLKANGTEEWKSWHQSHGVGGY